MLSPRTVSRREMIRLSATTLLSLSPLSTISCGRRLIPVDTDIDQDIYEEKNTVKAADVISIKEKKENVPNIIIILTDDMGYGDIGCYGNKAINTPHIDRMAREGMRFIDFYCASPLCSPSRAGLLTGRYPLRCGITFPLQPGKDTFMRKIVKELGYMFGALGVVDLHGAKNLVNGLPHSEITIAQALKLRNYATCAIGKWHLGDFVVDETYHPHNYGFDKFVGFNASNDDWPVSYFKDKKMIIEDIGLEQQPYTGLFTQEAIQFINENHKKPFFLYLAHKDPHQPCFPSKKFEGTTKAGPHGDTVAEVDWSVGQILQCLRKNNIDSKTLVIFTSDNGPWFDGSTGGLRGRKGESYDGGFRVPMIAWWPGTIKERTVCDQPVMNIDFFPTVCNLAGLTLPKDRIIDGKDLMPLLTGKSKQSPHDALYFFHYREIEGIRSVRWKYIRYNNTRGWPVPLDKPDTFFGSAAGGHDYEPPGSNQKVPTLATWPVLYDMEYDKSESYNVIQRYPDIGKKLHEKLMAFEKEFYANIRGWK